jgi:hypothetical protein
VGAGLLPEQDSPPPMLLPSISGAASCQYGPVPVFPVKLADPVIVLPATSKPPVLPPSDTLDLTLLPAQAGWPSSPPSPIITKPVVAETDTEPVMVAPQNHRAVAPVELSEALTVAPLTDSAPPEFTVTGPVTLPGAVTQTDWPEATVKPGTVVVMHGLLNVTAWVMLAEALAA